MTGSSKMIAVSAVLSVILLLGRVESSDAFKTLRGGAAAIERQLAVEAPMNYIACGTSNGNCELEGGDRPPVAGAYHSDLHQVRCCADGNTFTSDVTSEKKNANCGDVYGASKIAPGECHAGKTLDEATDICFNAGGRLCTREEIKSGATKGTGCSYDFRWIWTSSSYAYSDASHFVACGDPNKPSSDSNCKVNGIVTPNREAQDMETHGVRCCTTNGAPTGWEAVVNGKEDCPANIHAGAPTCMLASTYLEAEAACAAADARLCTKDEVQASCTINSGCGLDGEYIWTSTVYEDPLTAAARARVNDEIANSEHWIVCGSAETLTNEQGCLDENGIPRLTLQSPDTVKHEVRCCSENELTWPSAIKNEQCDVWGGSYIPFDSNEPACFHANTYVEALVLCEDNGARLCTQIEIANGCTIGSGCSHDKDWVWTSTPVGEDMAIAPSDGTHTLACSDPSKISAPGCSPGGVFAATSRAHDSNEHGFRCCTIDELDFFDGSEVKNNNCEVHAFGAVPEILGSTGPEISRVCLTATTHWEAAYQCSLLDARLCSQGEVLTGCTRGTDCGGETEYIWTNSASCVDEADCNAKKHTGDLVGCFEDGAHQLTIHQGTPHSIDSCFNLCKDAEYAYAGLKGGASCWCGDATPADDAATGTCDKACTIGEGFCGGTDAISLFETGVPVPDEIFSNFESKHLGCFKSEGHLNALMNTDADIPMSIVDCVETCSDENYAIGSLTNGGQCYCGNARPNAKSSDCNMACTAGKGICGGERGYSAYRTPNDRPFTDGLLQCSGVLSNFWGDPHLVTFDNLQYGCQGAGHFIMSQCPAIDYELQALFKYSPGWEEKFSVTDGVAAKYGTFPIVQFSIPDSEAEAINDGEYQQVINGCPIQILIGGVPQDIDQLPVTHLPGIATDTSITRNDNTFSVQFANNGPALKVKIREGRGCLFDVDTCLPEVCMNTETVGLLGSPNGDKSDDWMFNNGTVIDISGGIGGAAAFDYCTAEWCVQTEDDSLFTYPGDTTFEAFDFCAEDFPGDTDLTDAPEEIVTACLASNNPIACQTDAVNSENATRTIEEILDNEMDQIDEEESEDEEEWESIPMPPIPAPPCPLDVVQVSQQGDVTWTGESPIQVVSHDESTVTIKVMLPVESATAEAPEVFLEYRTEASRDVCESIAAEVDEEGAMPDDSVPTVFEEREVVVECLTSSPVAMVHLYAADASLTTSTFTSSELIPECCHVKNENPAIEYTFLVSCIRQCPDEAYA